MLSVPGGIDDELGVEEDDTLATLLRNHSGPNLIDSVIVSSKIKLLYERSFYAIVLLPGAIISSIQW